MKEKIVALRQEITTSEFRKFGIFLIASILIFFVFKCAGLYSVERIHTGFLIVGLVISILGSPIRMNAFVLPSRILLRTIFGLFGLYALAAYPTMPPTGLSLWDSCLLEYGRYITAIFAIGSFFRPSLGLMVLAYIFWYKAQLGDFIGTKLSVTDYMPLVEVAAFLVITQMLLEGCKRYGFYQDNIITDDKILNTGEKIFLTAVAIHMANYFYSAFQKIIIGDHPFSWALENQTQFLISNAAAYGQLPISFSPLLTGLSYDGLALLIVLTNLILFSGQIFSLFALLRIRWGIWTTLFYDLTHVVIFITSGIFFYKWIILNLSVVMALDTLKKRIVSPAFGLVLMLMVLLAPAGFWVAYLGWWDTPQTNIEYFSAVTKDGRDIKIPSNYFGSFSIVMAQQRVIMDKSEGFLPTSTYGLTREQRVMEKTLTCDQATGEGDIIKTTFSDAGNKIEPFIRKYHAWAMKQAGEDGRWLFDLYPHHIFSFPWEFSTFNTLNINDIVAYRYKVEASCVTMQNGKVVKTIQKEGQHDIPIIQP